MFKSCGSDISWFAKR